MRAVPWLGVEFIEFLEYHAFTTRDLLKRKFPGVFAEDAAKEVAADLGGAKIKPTFTDPEIGWPPAQLKPLIEPPLPNEGVWLGTDDDPFVGKNPGVPTAFVQTFIRTDAQRPYARVYVTLWDPRQVALHMVAGTIEPVSATGEVGTGQIPRTPETLKSLVAGFNGGFQAMHFEGGDAGQRHAVPAAEAVLRDRRRAGRRHDRDRHLARWAARGPRRHPLVTPEPRPDREGRRDQPVPAAQVGRHASRLGRRHPHHAQRRVHHEGQLRRLLLRQRHDAGDAGARNGRDRMHPGGAPRHERGPHRLRVLSGRANGRAPPT